MDSRKGGITTGKFIKTVFAATCFTTNIHIGTNLISTNFSWGKVNAQVMNGGTLPTTQIGSYDEDYCSLFPQVYVCSPTFYTGGGGSSGGGVGGGGPSGGNESGTGGGDDDNSEPETPKTCKLRVDDEFSLCESIAYNQYSVTISQECTKGGAIAVMFGNCIVVAGADRDAKLAACRHKRAKAMRDECN